MESNTNLWIKRAPIALIAVFIWIGFVCSISFMETWIKFQAVNITLPIGLSIGRVVFGALNKVEWFFAFTIMIYFSFGKEKLKPHQCILLITPVALLAIQTLFLLPALNERVEVILNGGKILPSMLHFYYLIMELIKVICLFTFGIIIFYNSHIA